MKLAIYCRVSTSLQEREETIQSQIAELKEIWKDHVIVREYIDNGWSGGNLDRPDLDRLREDAKAGVFDTLSIYSTDRLSRNLYHQGIIVEELRKKEIEIFVKDKPIANTADGKFVFNVLGAAAEYEKEKILERMRRGRLFKVRKKRILGYIPPYGYNYRKKTSKREGSFIINKKEAKIVKLIFDLYTKFQSINRVQRELTQRNINPRNATKWCRSTVGQILRRNAYTGIGFYNKRQSVEVENGKRYQKKTKCGIRKRPKEDWMEVNFPKIINRNKFNLVQKILSKKFKPFGKSKNFYLLSGLTRCALCNSTCAGSTNGRNWKHGYYRCTNRRKTSPYPKECDAKHIRADRVDPAVWSEIGKAITNPKILINHISGLADEIKKNNNGNFEEEKKILLLEKQTIALKKKKLEDLYFAGLKTITEYQTKMDQFNREGSNTDEGIKEIEMRVTHIVNRPLIMKNLQALCNIARQKLNTLNPEQRQGFLRYIIKEILLDSDTGKAKITGYVPLNGQEFNDALTQIALSGQSQIRPLSTLLKR